MHVQKTVSIQEVWETGFNRQNESTTLCLFFLSFFTKHQHFSQWKDILIILSPWDKKCLIFYFNQSSSSTLAPFILPHTQAPKFMCKEKNFSYLRQQTIPQRKHQTKRHSLPQSAYIYSQRFTSCNVHFSVSPTNLSLLRSP